MPGPEVTVNAVAIDGELHPLTVNDRPVAEPQVLRYKSPRPAGNRLPTQYLKLGEDPGSVGVLLSQPDWLWGAETALSTQRVAVGNEKIWTTDDPASAQPALIGMDLVRLAAEGAKDAAHAVFLIGRFLERYGQGGGGERGDDAATGTAPYWSSFPICLLYTSPSPRDRTRSRMPSSA